MDNRLFHFMGAIHAMEHALIGILPLLALTDRNDLGGISTPLHEQVGRAAVFVYDGIPGGMGLTRLAFDRAAEALSRTLAAIASCPCETGCPSCVHSPKCGSGNRPIDKAAAKYLLELLTSRDPEPAAPRPPEQGPAPARPQEPDMNRDAPSSPPASEASRIEIAASRPRPHPSPSLPKRPAPRRPPGRGGRPARTARRYGVLDVETRRSAGGVGAGEMPGAWGQHRRAVRFGPGRLFELPPGGPAGTGQGPVRPGSGGGVQHQALRLPGVGGVCDFPFGDCPPWTFWKRSTSAWATGCPWTGGLGHACGQEIRLRAPGPGLVEGGPAGPDRGILPQGRGDHPTCTCSAGSTATCFSPTRRPRPCACPWRGRERRRRSATKIFEGRSREISFFTRFPPWPPEAFRPIPCRRPPRRPGTACSGRIFQGRPGVRPWPGCVF